MSPACPIAECIVTVNPDNSSVTLLLALLSDSASLPYKKWHLLLLCVSIDPGTHYSHHSPSPKQNTALQRSLTSCQLSAPMSREKACANLLCVWTAIIKIEGTLAM